MILLTGYEAFDGRTENGSATLARRLHNRQILGHSIESRVLPVCWSDVREYCETTIAQSNAALVLGLGEADCERPRLELEAKPIASGNDNRGEAGPTLVDATPIRCTRLSCNPEWFADLDVSMDRSTDAGQYLCNWFLLHALLNARVAAGFVHVPIQSPSGARDYADKHEAAIVRFIEMNLTSIIEDEGHSSGDTAIGT